MKHQVTKSTPLQLKSSNSNDITCDFGPSETDNSRVFGLDGFWSSRISVKNQNHIPKELTLFYLDFFEWDYKILVEQTLLQVGHVEGGMYVTEFLW